MIKPDTILPLQSKELNVVAVIGWDDDFAVYQSYDMRESISNVARFGDKVSEKMGRELFPELEKYYYRW